MDTFVRRQNVSNGRGAIKYITKDSDGKILATYSTQTEQEWNILFDYNQQRFQEEKAKGTKYCNQTTKSGEPAKAMEAKMVIVALPNNMTNYPYVWNGHHITNDATLTRAIAEDWTATTGMDCYVALHLNDIETGKDTTNLHAHILSSNRKKKDSPELKRAKRNRYYDENGKECAKKNAVRIVHKGDIIGGQNKLYESGKIDMESVEFREKLYKHYSEVLGTKEFIKDGLHVAQQHLPQTNKRSSPEILEKVNQIKAHNEAVQEYNRQVDVAIEKEADLAPFKAQVIQYKENRKRKKDSIFVLLEYAKRVLREILQPTRIYTTNHTPKTALGRSMTIRNTTRPTTTLGRLSRSRTEPQNEPIIMNKDYTKRR